MSDDKRYTEEEVEAAMEFIAALAESKLDAAEAIIEAQARECRLADQLIDNQQYMIRAMQDALTPEQTSRPGRSEPIAKTKEVIH